ncbi:hypothetical protein CKA32_002914 [Geitlerinema sp. FC II]|nr:hypothetical protein CKA32_002914 [Geitlerinema sp. FC II]
MKIRGGSFRHFLNATQLHTPLCLEGSDRGLRLGVSKNQDDRDFRRHQKNIIGHLDRFEIIEKSALLSRIENEILRVSAIEF